MAVRDVAIVGLVGTLAYVASRMLQGDVLPVTAPAGEGGDYLARVRAAESDGRPYVKAKRSSASGIWQFTKDTWTRLGGIWGSDPSKAFGGLKPTIAEQNARMAQLTAQNRAALQRAGIAVTNATLYAAHFLGSSGAVTVLNAPDATPLAARVSAKVLAANPFLRDMTVAGFKAWLRRQVGG